MGCIKTCKSSSYSRFKRHTMLNALAEQLLDSEKETFLEITKIIFKCKHKEDIDKFCEMCIIDLETMGIDIEELGSLLGLLRNIYYNSKSTGELGELRGRMLELLLYHRFKQQYEQTDMRNHIILGEDNGRSDEVDVFGWDVQDERGEFYECKVNFRKIDNEDWKDYLRNLVNINRLLGGNNSYGFVSLSEDKPFQIFLERILKNQLGFNEAEVIGNGKLYTRINNYGTRKVS